MTERHVVDVSGRVGQPNIPACVVLGNLILPSVISGRDPERPTADLSPSEQMALAFRNMQRIVEAAGGSLNTIGKVTVYLKDMAHRGLVNEQWNSLFPDPHNRPARHVLQVNLPGSDWVQLDV